MASLPFFLLCLVAQALEPLVPELLEEIAQAAEALGAGAVQPACAIPALTHEVRLAQDAQVLRYRGARNVGKVRRDGSGRELVVAHESKDLAPAGLGNCLDGFLHGSDNCKRSLT
jgi:hypothetical protein